MPAARLFRGYAAIRLSTQRAANETISSLWIRVFLRIHEALGQVEREDPKLDFSGSRLRAKWGVDPYLQSVINTKHQNGT